MEKLTVIAVVVVAVAGLLGFANDNYDSISSSLSASIKRDIAKKAERREAEATKNLAMISDVDALLIDAPDKETTHGYIAYRVKNTDVRDEAVLHLDAFFTHAFNNEAAWDGASVRLYTIKGGQKIWVSDLKRTRDGVMSGRVIRSAKDNSYSFARVGSRYEFQPSEVWDWAITHENGVHGLFSIRYNMDLLSPEIIETANKNLSAEAVPSSW